MDLSVVIVSWNVRQLLSGCLESVFASVGDSALQHEVLVVDNASSDGSASMVREHFPQVRVWENAENRGFAAGCNQALSQCSGRHVLLLNPDTLVRRDAPGVLVGFMDTMQRVGMAGPRLVYPDGSFQHSAFEFPTLAQAFLDFFPIHARLTDSKLNGRYPRADYAAGHAFRVGHPLGACIIVRRKALEQVGCLDEGFFMYCEEVDWALRFHRAVWRVYCVPMAEVAHYSGQSTQQFRDEMFVQLWRSRLRLFAKHYGASYNRAVRIIVRGGVRVEAMRARARARGGQLSQQGLAAKLAAYERVLQMTRGRWEDSSGPEGSGAEDGNGRSG